jgi:hypothetical protein
VPTANAAHDLSEPLVVAIGHNHKRDWRRNRIALSATVIPVKRLSADGHFSVRWLTRRMRLKRLVGSQSSKWSVEFAENGAGHRRLQRCLELPSGLMRLQCSDFCSEKILSKGQERIEGCKGKEKTRKTKNGKV